MNFSSYPQSLCRLGNETCHHAQTDRKLLLKISNLLPGTLLDYRPPDLNPIEQWMKRKHRTLVFYNKFDISKWVVLRYELILLQVL